MTSRERIRAALEFRTLDRVGIYDNFCEETLKVWQNKGLDPEVNCGDYFDFDFRLFGADQDLKVNYTRAKNDDKKFITFSASGPFEKLKRTLGFESALVALSRQPKLVEKKIAENCDFIIKQYLRLKNEGFSFDGFWLWEDIAYQQGLLFSLATYKKILFGFHKRLCRFFRGEGLGVIFHSDGDVREVIPWLIEAEVLALHPLESSCGMDISELRKEYKKNLVLFGNINTHTLSQTKEAISAEIKDKLSLAGDGGYIYCCDSPIPQTVSLENYKFTLETVRQIKLK